MELVLVFGAGFPEVDFSTLAMPWLSVGLAVLVAVSLVVFGSVNDPRDR
jgi:hypothetical protein